MLAQVIFRLRRAAAAANVKLLLDLVHCLVDLLLYNKRGYSED